MSESPKNLNEAADGGLRTTALFGWLHEKLEAAEKTLKAREQSEESWRGGNQKEWDAAARMAGMMPMKKSQRIEQAEMQKRIAVKARHEVEMFKVVIEALQSPPNV
jgi:glutamate mutase epsilon subunit